jgi:hypothetical protein
VAQVGQRRQFIYCNEDSGKTRRSGWQRGAAEGSICLDLRLLHFLISLLGFVGPTVALVRAKPCPRSAGHEHGMAMFTDPFDLDVTTHSH